MTRLKVLKCLDACLGSLLVLLCPKPGRSKDALIPQSVLFIRPGGIGDAVLLAFAIRALKATYPACSVDILAEKRNACAFEMVPGVRSIYRYDELYGVSSVLSRAYDVVIDTEQWHRLSALVARLVRSPVKIGFGTNIRRRMFTHSIPYDHETREIESFCNLLKPLGINSVENSEPFLAVPNSATNRVVDLISFHYSYPYVVLFPGASIPERRWGADKFSQVSKELVVAGYGVVVVGGREDATSGEIICQKTGINLAGKTSLVESAAVISCAQLLVSGDSGILHLGVGLGIPTVSLFGPGIAAKWAPQGERHIVLNKGLPCAPCTCFGTTPPCKRNAECLAKITPEEVAEAVFELLARTGQNKFS